MSSQSLPVAGTTLHVDDTDEPDVPPVLCLHSLFLDNRMFDDLVEAGRGRFRFVRPEFRGQGRSAGADRDILTMEQAAGDMAALLDKLGITSAHVAASSMGGDVAARLAAFRPDLVRSIVFLGSSVRREPPEAVGEYVAWTNDVGENGFTGERLAMLERVMLGESTRNDPAKRDTTGLWIGRLAALPTSLKPAMLGVMLRHDAVELLGDIAAPALVVSGEECWVRPPDWAAELADALPDSELVMLPEVGHSPLIEAPDIVIPRVLEFFASH
ncbi:alpha/beta fold hydrolase [Embleya hyalina]|uniref:Alpha/beta hydrolase n=1 Tax=Embleya hyalina TaxID=516124 RepID=A0A401YNI8_9ACTN|nr:alpha/beta hydrolase [Embleya hyalina]GCD96158.1 alpha/beta hydrolase [Embleya hyalina]